MVIIGYLTVTVTIITITIVPGWVLLSLVLITRGSSRLIVTTLLIHFESPYQSCVSLGKIRQKCACVVDVVISNASLVPEI